MSLNESLREQLIRQFEADVSIIKDKTGLIHYICPSCQRKVALEEKKCRFCEQKLNWEHMDSLEIGQKGKAIATITFEVPVNFEKGNCGSCSLAYCVNQDGYEEHVCPLGLRADCPIEIKQI